VGALIKTGTDGMIIGEDDLRLLTSGGALDPSTRAVPVLLQVANSDGRLKINETVPVELYTSESKRTPAIPYGSVYEDEGLSIVFVQTEGEAFEKRVVRTGPRYENWVPVLDGVGVGERVVSKGGYHVKLASTSAEIGHGHAH
jgi:multidrug efflux pump subunit AcrA (membrane-fusion protein)